MKAASRRVSRDKTVRNLAALARSGSSMRVLNLATVALRDEETAGYAERPFFENRLLNASIIVKHRLRPSETDLFADSRRHGTKIVIPFDRHDLSRGGYSVFVGERRWFDCLAEVIPQIDPSSRDIAILYLLDQYPSLDPFLISELMKRAGHDIAPCYFNLNATEVERMRRFTANEIRQLIDLALGDRGVNEGGLLILVESLLTGGDDGRLTPLRRALRMSEPEFSKGLFAWRGILYYKWQHERLLKDAQSFMKSLKSLQISGPIDDMGSSQLRRSQVTVVAKVRNAHQHVARLMRSYDSAYSEITSSSNAARFRTFLLEAPQMFDTLSETIGITSDLIHYWLFMFPGPLRPTLTIEGALSTLADFDTALTQCVEDIRI